MIVFLCTVKLIVSVDHFEFSGLYLYRKLMYFTQIIDFMAQNVT